MLLRVHKKRSFSLPVFPSLSAAVGRRAHCRLHEKRSSIVAQLYERLERAVVAFRLPVHVMCNDFPSHWSKKTSYQEIKIKNSKIAYTKLSTFFPPFAPDPSQEAAKKETRNWQILICFRLFYMLGINKTTNLQKGINESLGET